MKLYKTKYLYGDLMIVGSLHPGTHPSTGGISNPVITRLGHDRISTDWRNSQLNPCRRWTSTPTALTTPSTPARTTGNAAPKFFLQ